MCGLEQDPQQQERLSATDQAPPLAGVISHLLFEPTLLASTGRRRFTLQNDTTGDLPVRWKISEINSLQEKQQQQPKGSAVDFASAQPAGSSPKTSSPVAIAGTPGLSRQSSQLAVGVAIPACAAPSGGSGRDQAAETGGARRTHRQETGIIAATSTFRNIDGKDGHNCVDPSYPTRSLEASSSSSVVCGTVNLPTDTTEAVAGRAPDKEPFGIFPEFAVVPAHGERTFEVAFSPPGLGESR